MKSIPLYDESNVIVGAIEVFTDERFQREIMNENELLKDEIMKDPLTQIANRRFFEFSLNKKIEQYQLFSKSFGVLMFDIDHYKNFNDTYGHVLGDDILKLVAKSLVSNIKTYDVISRWGGEEFVGLFEVDSDEALFSIAERLRNIVAKSSFKEEGKPEIKVTISIGGTMMGPLCHDKLLIEKADQALYQSKQTGRNKTTII